MRVALVLALCFRVFALQFADGFPWLPGISGGYVITSALDEIISSLKDPDPLKIVESFQQINGKLLEIETEVRLRENP